MLVNSKKQASVGKTKRVRGTQFHEVEKELQKQNFYPQKICINRVHLKADKIYVNEASILKVNWKR